MIASYNDPVPRYPRAVLYLPARLVREGGGYRLLSGDLPEGLRLGMSARFARFARRVLGEERVFVAYPRTDREGRLTRLDLASAHERPPEGFAPGEGEAVGRVVLARKRVLVLEVARRVPARPFRLTLVRREDPLPWPERGGGLAARVRLERGRLLSTRVEPVELLAPGEEGRVLAPALPFREPEPKPEPAPVREEPRPEPEPLPELPPLGKGRYMGLVGEGPYYIVVRPQLAGRWAQIEARLDLLPPGHRVLRYPDGTVAVEFKDREPLRVLYKSLFE